MIEYAKALAVLILLIAVVQVAVAVPANPKPFELFQPDGTSFKARMVGDERSAFFETLEGYIILKDSNGWWHYAKLDNGRLAPSSYIVGRDDPSSLVIEKHLRPKKPYKSVNVPYTLSYTPLATLSAIYKVSRAPSNVPIQPVTGTQKVLVLLVEFADVKHNSNYTPEYYYNLLFNNSTGANSLINYYNEVSYGKIDIVGEIGNKWFIVPNNLSYYGEDVTGIDENTNLSDPNGWYIFKLARDAVIAADPYVNFSKYDTDGDGVVDHLIIIHAGSGEESTGNSTDIWSHRETIENFEKPFYLQPYKIQQTDQNPT